MDAGKHAGPVDNTPLTEGAELRQDLRRGLYRWLWRCLRREKVGIFIRISLSWIQTRSRPRRLCEECTPVANLHTIYGIIDVPLPVPEVSKLAMFA